MPCQVDIYDRDTIDQISWPSTAEGEMAKQFLLPLMKEGIEPYVRNVKTDLKALKVGDHILPITINEAEYSNSYVCSPYAQYFNYACEEIKHLKSRLLKKILRKIYSPVGVFFKWGQIDKTICVNNWLISTNLFPPLTEKEVQAITGHLKKNYPAHSILFKSLNSFTNQDLMGHLKKQSYRKVISRPVYLLDTRLETPFKANMFKKDLGLLKKQRYIHSKEYQPEDGQRLEHIYKCLYLDKYSSLNQDYTEKFFTLPCLNLRTIRQGNTILGAYGLIQMHGISTLVWLGYDTSLPQDLGLYRSISTYATLDAKDKGDIFHMSAGASSFKRLRRAEGHIEYYCIHIAHLPLRRKLPWLFINSFTPLATYILRKFQV